MRLTKYTHACVRLDDTGPGLVIDPGSFSEASTALDGADAVLITHEHADHLDADALRAAAEANPALRVWAPEPVARSLADLGDSVTSVEAGTSFEAAGFTIRTFGGQHALIHPLIPMIANVGYLIEGGSEGPLYHPGDSFDVPEERVGALLLPTHAPWSKIGEVIDFMVAVKAPRAFQIHDALLNETGTGMVEGMITGIGDRYGTTFRHLDSGEKQDL